VSNSGERKRKEARHTPPGMQRGESVAQKEPRNTGGLKSIKGLFFSFSIPVQYHQSEGVYQKSRLKIIVSKRIKKKEKGKKETMY
jgi:hypothetical protein